MPYAAYFWKQFGKSTKITSIRIKPVFQIMEADIRMHLMGSLLVQVLTVFV
jgi:hypothetical protein